MQPLTLPVYRWALPARFLFSRWFPTILVSTTFIKTKTAFTALLLKYTTNNWVTHQACRPLLQKHSEMTMHLPKKTARVIGYSSIISIPDENKKFREDDGFAFAEPGFFSIFNF